MLITGGRVGESREAGVVLRDVGPVLVTVGAEPRWWGGPVNCSWGRASSADRACAIASMAA